jgi:Uma2 family endonuclease
MTTATASNAHDTRPFRPVQRRWTSEEYCRLYDQGFFVGQRVELIFGRIIQMAPQRSPQSVAIELVDQFVRRAFPTGHRYRIQLTLSLKPKSEPEPDIAVVPGQPRGQTSHPGSAVLVVEVSEATLEYDRNQKARLYARNGLDDYWILNLVDRQLEVYRDPLARGGRRGGPAYASVKFYASHETIAPLGAAGMPVRIDELLL